MSDPLIAQTINGKFKVHAVIGRGGMGRVYRAEQVPLGRAVALKVLHSKPGAGDVDPAFQRRFFLEASLCAKLSHPNVVTVFDYGRIETPALAEDSYFMAMEFLEGETLHKRLKTRGAPLEPGDALGIAVEITRGLREAHRHGIVHRDLKPGNVMLVPDAEAGEKLKILDFGLVKQVEGENSEDLTQEGAFLGSPKYMAPEQVEHAPVDHRVDLYALGVILYECLTGKVPFDEPSSMHTLLAHVQKPVPPMRERNPEASVPEPLEALTRRLLGKKPDERPASAEELLRDLRALQRELGLESGLVSARTHTTAAAAAAPAGLEVPPVEPSNSLVGTARSFTGELAAAERSRVEPPPRRSAALYAVAGAGALAALLAAVLALRGPAATASAGPSATASAALTPPPAAASHTLTIESTPAGATVTEGGRVLGTTPLRIALDGAQVSPREFVLSSAGYTAYTLRQPPASEDTRVVAALSPEPASALAGAHREAPDEPDERPALPAPRPASAPRPTPRPTIAARPPRPASAAPSATAAPALDIRSER